MTIRDLTLIALLGACGGLGVLTTGVFHALIPLPGFGALLFMPLATACVVMARDRINHRWAAGFTKLVQQVVTFFLPGGPMIAHNPVMIPLMALDGFLFDLIYRLRPWSLAKNRFTTAALAAICGAAGTALQVGIVWVLAGQNHLFLSQGYGFFLAVFLGLHSILRFVGELVGAMVLRSIPQRSC